MGIIMKLEFKHLAFYFPYNVLVNMKHNKGHWNSTEMLDGLKHQYYRTDKDPDIALDGFDFKPLHDDAYVTKLVLRPWSDIFTLFVGKLTPEHWDQLTSCTIPAEREELPYFIMQMLAEAHIDIFDLLENNLAINLNECNYDKRE